MHGDFYLAAWLVQPALGRLSLDNRTVSVRPKVMDLLVYLAQSPGIVISKETLLNDVWGTEAITESALTRTITELRAALGDDVNRPRFLETIPKRGYRLVAPVRPVEVPEVAAQRRRTPARAIWLATVLAVVGSTVFLVFTMARKDATTILQVRPFTTLPGQEGQPSFSADGRQIAFVWSKSGDSFDVYVKRIGEDAVLSLTTDPAPDVSPVWSPDGRAVAFARRSNEGVALYVVGGGGGTERLITKLRRRSAPIRPRMLDWTADGRALVVAEQDGAREPFYLMRLSTDSGERRRLTSPPPHSYGDTQPVVSPDGRTLAFTRWPAPGSSDIYLLPLTGGEPIRLTFDDQVITGLTWSADGQSIVFSSERGAMASTGSLWRVRATASTVKTTPDQLPGIGPRAIAPTIARQAGRLAYQEYFQDTNLWRVSTTGADAPRLVVSSTREENQPDFSPDGSRIAFGSNRSGNWEIWTADADGSNQQRITAYGAAPAAHPRWSPDGRLLAFHHVVRGNADVYTITPEGSSMDRLTSEPSAEETPAWSADGRWIYFSSNRSGAYEIWKLAVDQPARALQITRGGGMNPREATNRDRIFYSKRTAAGIEIWTTGVNGGSETRVFGPVRSPAGWAPDPNGIYFIEPAGRISYYRFATGLTVPILLQHKDTNPYNPGLALSPDGRWLLVGQMDDFGADLMLVENFQ